MAPALSPPRLPPVSEPLSSWQQAVLDELRGIRAALERRRPVTTLSRADRAALARAAAGGRGRARKQTIRESRSHR